MPSLEGRAEASAAVSEAVVFFCRHTATGAMLANAAVAERVARLLPAAICSDAGCEARARIRRSASQPAARARRRRAPARATRLPSRHASSTTNRLQVNAPPPRPVLVRAPASCRPAHDIQLNPIRAHAAPSLLSRRDRRGAGEQTAGIPKTRFSFVSGSDFGRAHLLSLFSPGRAPTV